ncbi:MAG: preprotein translocase subunit SecG [Clostridia bacterium]|nr:preprotein translocase subunit SecG [Clostridia bacterium]
MTWYVILMAAIVLVTCVAVVAVVLLQSARSASISGTIAGGADKLFGGKDKKRARTIDEKLEKATPYMAGVIIVLVVALNLVYLFSK